MIPLATALSKQVVSSGMEARNSGILAGFPQKTLVVTMYVIVSGHTFMYHIFFNDISVSSLLVIKPWDEMATNYFVTSCLNLHLLFVFLTPIVSPRFTR
jgi:hypothetical protein